MVPLVLLVLGRHHFLAVREVLVVLVGRRLQRVLVLRVVGEMIELGLLVLRVVLELLGFRVVRVVPLVLVRREAHQSREILVGRVVRRRQRVRVGLVVREVLEGKVCMVGE